MKAEAVFDEIPAQLQEHVKIRAVDGLSLVALGRRLASSCLRFRRL